jgi:gamma-glutamylcyclotransferase (GGCT)/AIG2-like uncharacterized protein YtfP
MSRFVYGSLMAPEVLSALLGRIPHRVPATIRGYHRFNIKERVYPALYRTAAQTTQGEGDGGEGGVEGGVEGEVRGEVLSGMSRRELAILDWFEGKAPLNSITQSHHLRANNILLL